MNVNSLTSLTTMLLLHWLPSITTCLQCYVGTHFQSDLQNETTMTSLECPGPDQVCQRMEATATAFEFLNVTILVTQCNNASSCTIGTSCQGLDELFLSSDEEPSGDLSGLQFEVNSCDVACCIGPDCNNKKISLIRESAVTVQSGDMPKPTSGGTGVSRQISITKAVTTVFVLALLTFVDTLTST